MMTNNNNRLVGMDGSNVFLFVDFSPIIIINDIPTYLGGALSRDVKLDFTRGLPTSGANPPLHLGQFPGFPPHQNPPPFGQHVGIPSASSSIHQTQQQLRQESAEEAKRRFEIECEFVQALANPNYLNYLAQRGYFKEEYFANYLKYLLYWKRAEYARCLKWPQCLFFLEALQSAEFREALASADNAHYIEDQQLLQWHFYIRQRQRLIDNNTSSSTRYCGCTPLISLIIFITSLARLVIICAAQPVDELYFPSRCESFKMSKDHAEAWLIEELELVCGRMLDYRLHKTRRGLARFDKERTGTAKTIKKLRERGVEVKLDVTDELLDHPSIESARLKEHCEWIVEEFESDIEQWFIHKRPKTSLEEFLCLGRLAKEFDGTCAHIHRDEL